MCDYMALLGQYITLVVLCTTSEATYTAQPNVAFCLYSSNLMFLANLNSVNLNVTVHVVSVIESRELNPLLNLNNDKIYLNNCSRRGY
jgi:hypothetical protein